MILTFMIGTFVSSCSLPISPYFYYFLSIFIMYASLQAASDAFGMRQDVNSINKIGPNHLQTKPSWDGA